MSKMIDNFEQLCRILLETTSAPPFPERRELAIGTDAELLNEMTKQIEATAKTLPLLFDKAFTQPFRAKLRRIQDRLLNSSVVDDFKLTAIATAATQPWKGEGTAIRVRQLQAIVSDLYKSFVWSREELGLPQTELQQLLPPIVTFISDVPIPVPYMVDIDQMQKISNDFRVGILTVPDTYLNHPLLWAVIGHEVGGHGVLAADEELIPEILKGISKQFGSTDILGKLWRYWGEESASDVCGILNIGPSYSLAAAIFYAFLSERTPTHLLYPMENNDLGPFFTARANMFPETNIIDSHPIPVLIPHLLLGAIDKLDDLKRSVKDEYIRRLEELADRFSQTRSEVDFKGKAILGPSRNPVALPDRIPLKELKDSARFIGEYLATARFQALNGYSLQNLETWDDADEDISTKVSAKLLSDEPISGISRQDFASTFDDAQIMAGGLIAALKEPKRYHDINKQLLDAFDVSFDEDNLLNEQAAKIDEAVLKDDQPSKNRAIKELTR